MIPVETPEEAQVSRELDCFMQVPARARHIIVHTVMLYLVPGGWGQGFGPV